MVRDKHKCKDCEIKIPIWFVRCAKCRKKNTEICKYQTEEDGYFGCALKEEDCLYAYPCGTFISLDNCSVLKKKREND